MPPASRRLLPAGDRPRHRTPARGPDSQAGRSSPTFDEWAGLNLTYPATVVRLKGKQSVWIRSWRDGMESYLRLAHIVPAPEPLPDPQDFGVIMSGDSVYRRGEWAIVAWLAAPDRAVISIPVPECKWKQWWKEGRKERDEGSPIPRVRPVKLKELTPAPPRPEENLHPLLVLIFRESLAAETACVPRSGVDGYRPLLHRCARGPGF